MKFFKHRYFLIFVAGLVIALVFYVIESPDFHKLENPHTKMLHNILLTLFITFLVWEGNYWMTKLLDKYFSWEEEPLTKVCCHVSGTIVYSSLAVIFPVYFYVEYVCNPDEKGEYLPFGATVALGLLISLLIAAIHLGTYFFHRWKDTRLQAEMFKKESIQAQYENLKNQINPHFLFNSLSVLTSLVYKDADLAADFIAQLSKVYRYVLDSKDKELVQLKTELDSLDSYIFLMKIRFGGNIKFNVQAPTNQNSFLIVPLALQMLIENAIKHNIVSSEQPLTVNLYIENEDYIVVQNNLQGRVDETGSNNIGLANISSRYNYLTEKQVVVHKTAGEFTVKLPLLTIDDESTNR